MGPRRLGPLLTLLLATAASLASQRPARSLPLFSRSQDVTCARCHDVAPHLNAAGIAFAERGYRGTRRGPESSGHARAIPLSVVGSEVLSDSRSAVASVAAGRPTTTETVRLKSLALLSAGAIDERISFRIAAGFERRRDHVDGSGEAFLQVDDLIPRAGLNLRLGRFDAEVPFLSRSRRTTLADYLSPISLDARALELNGRRSCWSYAGGLALSERHSSGGPSPRRIANPLEDSYLRLSRTVGAHAIAAQMVFDRQDSNLPAHAWLQHLRAQVAACIALRRCTVTPSYVFDRFDDRPAAGVHEHHHYSVLETVAPLDAAGRWAITGRYEHDDRTPNAYDPEEHREQATLSLGWQASPNTRLAVEWSHADERLDRHRQEDLDAFIQASW